MTDDARPLWEPSPERIERANLSRFIRYVRESNSAPEVIGWPDLESWALREPDRFWLAVWDFCGIRASGEREPVLVDRGQMPGARFFPNVRLNFAQNLLRFSDERAALIAVDELGGSRKLSYAELNEHVSRWSQALAAAGVGPGDRVAGLLPNGPEAVIAMLATTSLGAVWSSTSPDFGVEGIVDRFGQIAPKVMIATAGYGYGGKRIALGAKVKAVATAIAALERVVVVPWGGVAMDGTIPRAVALDAFLAPYAPRALTFAALEFNAPLYVMYSSGTTGAPKCIVHGVGGTLIEHLKELVLHVDLKRDDRLFYYTTCGWMMWNWLVSGLAVGATVVLYDGSPTWPDAKVLWDLADAEKISVFGTSAKYLASIEKAGIKPRESHRLTALKTILSTGSPLAPEGFEFVYRDIKERVLLASISGGTDILGCFALGNPLLPVWAGELQCRSLGLAVEVLDDDGKPIRGAPGELACLAPFPSMPVGFWNDADGARYRAAYFDTQPNVWCHGDFAEITRRAGVVIYGRSDATLNPGGVRIGTAEIYRQVERVPEVEEAIAVGQDHDHDVRVILFVRLRPRVMLDDALIEVIKRTIRDGTTPRHVPAKVIQIADIPRTRSGKISELAVRNVIHGRAVKNTDALANPEALALYRDLPQLCP